MQEHKESQTNNEPMAKVDVDEEITNELPRLPDKVVVWLADLALRSPPIVTSHPQRIRPPTEESVLRLLIVVVGMVLIVLALVAVGAADQVGEVLRDWPVIP